MIDLATCWIEIRTVLSAQADRVANQVELAWLTRYSLPNKVIGDRGNEFLAEFREMITNDYGIKVKPITSRNPSQCNIGKSARNNWQYSSHFQSTKYGTG